MRQEPRYVDAVDNSELMFSVCSLVRDQEKYEKLLGSFTEYGFTPENSEFLAADNRNGNQFDGYSWHKHLHGLCRGKYVIYCHEDVMLIDQGFDDLVAAMQKLEEMDPKWLVAGIAGSPWRPINHSRTNQSLHITDFMGENRRIGEMYVRAESLDECFIVMRRMKPVINSYDLSGFHYYGADICIQAELLGGRAYTFDFHLKHYGQARATDDFYDCRKAFIAKYGKYFPGRIMHCTTGRFALGGGWYDAQ